METETRVESRSPLAARFVPGESDEVMIDLAIGLVVLVVAIAVAAWCGRKRD